MTTESIRHKLYDYIRLADHKKLNAIYNLMKDGIEQRYDWPKDKQFVSELDKRYYALESGADKGLTLPELEASVYKQKKHEKEAT